MIERVRGFVTSKPAMLSISLLFTLSAIWLAVRNIDAGQILSALDRMPAWPYVVSFCFLIAGTLVRGLRFHILMRRNRSTFLASLEMIVIGYLFTTLLPLRTGELVRIGYFSRRTQIPALTTTTAIMAERAMDLIALAFLAAIFLSGLAGRHFSQLPAPPWALGLAAGIGAAGALAFGLLARRRLLNKRSDTEGRSTRWFDEALRGLTALGSVRDAVLAMGLSVALWIMVSISIRFAFQSVELDIPISDAAVIMLGTCFAIALPSTPGFVGTYHLGFVAGALLVGIPREISLPVAFVFHLVIQVPFLPIGGLILFTGGRKALAKPPGTQSTSR